MSPSEEHGVLAAIDETPEDGSPGDSRLAHPFLDEDDFVDSTFNSASDIFTRFIMQLGPSMVSILCHCKVVVLTLSFRNLWPSQ